MIKPLELAPLSQAQWDELDTFYRTTKAVRLRTRAHTILLAAEQKMTAPTMAALVRETDQTVRNWLKRDEAEGIEGLKSQPQPGPPGNVTPDYQARLIEVVRVRPAERGTTVFGVGRGSLGGLSGGADGDSSRGRDRAVPPESGRDRHESAPAHHQQP